MEITLEPLWLTLRLALVTTLLLLLFGVPLAAWLAFARFKGKAVIESLVSLPLVLPPSVMGFYLLLAFSPANAFGHWLQEVFHFRLVFSFTGLVAGSVLYSLPFMVHPVQAGLQALPVSYRHASYTLGKSRMQTLLRVLLPNCRAALLTGMVLTFAHTIGEFGLVLMIGGNIAGETKVASIAVYDEVEALHYHTAHIYSLILLVVSFSILLLVYLVNKRLFKKSLVA